MDNSDKEFLKGEIRDMLDHLRSAKRVAHVLFGYGVTQQVIQEIATTIKEVKIMLENDPIVQEVAHED